MFYYEIIEKTALLSPLLALGAQSVIEDEVQVENMRKFVNSSEWQIKMIYLIIQTIGKPTGIDIKEQNDIASYLCFEYL
jgi:octaprenyl-diphosphate synthase